MTPAHAHRPDHSRIDHHHHTAPRHLPAVMVAAVAAIAVFAATAPITGSIAVAALLALTLLACVMAAELLI